MATKPRIINTKNLEKYLSDFPNSGGTKGYQFGNQIKNLIEYIINDSDLTFGRTSIDELQAALESITSDL